MRLPPPARAPENFPAPHVSLVAALVLPLPPFHRSGWPEEIFAAQGLQAIPARACGPKLRRYHEQTSQNSACDQGSFRTTHENCISKRKRRECTPNLSSKGVFPFRRVLQPAPCSIRPGTPSRLRISVTISVEESA